jgi:hypothetical protein
MNEWKKFSKVLHKMFGSARNKYNYWLVKSGYPAITNSRCIPDSPYLNLNGFPEELDYTDLRPLPEK